MVAIFERERPQTLDDIAGLHETIQRLEALHEAVGFCGQALYFSGPSGVGKTTIARIIANMISDPCCIEEMDAQNLTVEKLREIQSNAGFKPMFGDVYSVIVNELHAANPKTVQMLQTVLEDRNVQRNCTFIFTTTTESQQYLFDKRDAMALMGRMLIFELRLTEDDYIAMAERLAKIATKYKLGKPDVPKCRKLIADCGGSMRAAIQAVAVGALA